MGDRIVRMGEVQGMLGGVSRQAVYDWMAAGKFPQSRSIVPGGRAMGWLASEVEAWLAERRGVTA